MQQVFKSLTDKQVEFTRTMAYFQVWCVEQDFKIIEAESFRTPEQAALYAKQGKGIINSTHRHKLARDLFRKKGGTITWDKEDYREMGEKWKSMHPLARWGGDFKRRDAVHFSFEHRGVK